MVPGEIANAIIYRRPRRSREHEATLENPKTHTGRSPSKRALNWSIFCRKCGRRFEFRGILWALHRVRLAARKLLSGFPSVGARDYTPLKRPSVFPSPLKHLNKRENREVGLVTFCGLWWSRCGMVGRLFSGSVGRPLIGGAGTPEISGGVRTPFSSMAAGPAREVHWWLRAWVGRESGPAKPADPVRETAH